MSKKHTVRFHFWKNRYNSSQHNTEAMDGFVMDWEDREFEEFEEAIRFAKQVESPLVKIMNELGHVIYNSLHKDAHTTYA